MRLLSGLLAAFVLGLAGPVLAAEPQVGELVEAAVKALRTTCYEARMHFFAQYDAGREHRVRIYHVAPDLYHVRPLAEDKHGVWTEEDHYYLENAEELLLITRRPGGQDIISELPERSFYLNDALTGKFLRDLARYPGTTVRSGKVGTYDIHVLLQTAQPEKPYTITVGLDRSTSFPLYLLVNDSEGVERVYFEMEAIEYRSPQELDPRLFTPPAVGGKYQQRSPRVEQLAPGVILELKEAEGADRASVQIQRSASNVDYSLPPYPTNVPLGYQLEGLHLLDFPISDAAGDVALVYQFELFSPASGDTLSIFLTQTDELDLGSSMPFSTVDGGYVVQRLDGWVVAIFGGLTPEELQLVASGLTDDAIGVENLLEMTKARDLVLEQALNISD